METQVQIIKVIPPVTINPFFFTPETKYNLNSPPKVNSNPCIGYTKLDKKIKGS